MLQRRSRRMVRWTVVAGVCLALTIGAAAAWAAVAQQAGTVSSAGILGPQQGTVSALSTDLTFTKGVDANDSGVPGPTDTAVPGQVVTYTITVQNNDLVSSGSIAVTDTLPAELTLIEGSVAGSGTVTQQSAHEVVWDFGVLNPQDLATATFSATVATTFPQTTNEIANTAVAEESGSGQLLSSTATLTVAAESSLTVDKGVDANGDGVPTLSEVASPGQVVTYTVTLGHAGSAPTGLLDVQDTLPQGFVPQDPQNIADGGVWDGNAGTITWTGLAPIAPGSQTILTYPVVVPATSDQPSQEYVNNVIAQDQTIGGQLPAAATVLVNYPSDLSVTKTVDANGDGISNSTEAASPGNVVTYTVNVANNGTGPASSVTATDVLDPQLTLVPGSITGSGQYDANTRTIVWPVGDVAPGTPATFAFSATLASTYPKAANQIGNTVYAEQLGGAPVSSTATVTVNARLGMTLDKRANVSQVVAGNSVMYSYVVTNTGEAPLKNVTVTDNRLGAIGSIPNLNPNTSSTLTKSAVLSTLGPITNVATATAVDADGVAAPAATDQVTVNVVSGGGGGGGGGGDTVPPTVSATVSNPNWTNASRVDVTITAADNSGNVTLTYDGAPQPVSGASPVVVTVPVTVQGQTTLHFTATDGAGLTASGSALVKIDRTAPTTPTSLAYSGLTSDRVDLTWNASTDALSGIASYDVYDGATKIGSATGGAFSATSLTPGTAHEFSVTALDKAGNSSPKSAVLSVTLPAGSVSVSIPVGSTVTTTVLVPMAGGGTAPVTVTLTNVTRAGALTIFNTALPPHDPSADLSFLSSYFDLSFTGTFSGATVTLPYDGRLPVSRAKNLVVRHWNGTSWQTETVTAIDTAKQTITYTTTSFSAFALAEPLGINTNTRISTTWNLVVPYGTSANIVARVLDASGTVLPGKRIVTISTSRDKVNWGTPTTMMVVSGKPGSYTAKANVISGGRTYVKVTFVSDAFNMTSSGIVTVMPKLYMTWPAIAASKSRTTTISGTIKPAHAAAITLEMQRKSGKRWITTRIYLRASSAGKWSKRVTFTKGTWRLRALGSADTFHAASAGQWRPLFVY